MKDSAESTDVSLNTKPDAESSELFIGDENASAEWRESERGWSIIVLVFQASGELREIGLLRRAQD